MLLRTDSLPEQHFISAELDNLGFEDELIFVITSPDDLILLEKSPAMFPNNADEPGLDIYQTEFPIEAVSWIVDSIENKLWKSEQEGGLPSGTYHTKTDIRGETLKIRRSMNVGGPGQKGFSLQNMSRPHKKDSSMDYQETHVTDLLLREGGLLDILKGIAHSLHS